MPADDRFMRLALQLARRGEGLVEPNPMVGAVVVSLDGQIVGQGWHRQFGGPHAEIHALREAGKLAHGGTLYVTLEPCCHTGKTPPCTEAILSAGIGRVVVALEDPFPKVAGRGIRQLRQQNITCDVGLLGDDARKLIAPYLKRLRTGRPWVIAKWAMTLDGKIATSTGSSQWISGEASRAVVHQLRGRVDAILVGAGTVRADDPLLTARPPGPRVATRYALGEIPVSCQLVQTARQIPLVVALGTLSAQKHRSALEDLGIEVLSLGSSEPQSQVRELLDEMGRRQVTNLLVEGGSHVLGHLFDSDEIDEVHTFVAPKLVGGSESFSPIGGHGLQEMQQAIGLTGYRLRMLGGDLYLSGRIPRSGDVLKNQ